MAGLLLAALGGALIAGDVSAQQRVRIALLPVVVHSAEDPAYLREGLADMLVSRLEQAGVFEVQRLDDPGLATTSLERAVEIGREAGADFVIFGSFTRFGQGASLDVQCAATSRTAEGPPLRQIFVHSGSIGDVIPDLDELVGKVARFAVADYEAPMPVSAAGPSAPRERGTVEKLRRRIEALEVEVRELRRSVEESGRKREGRGPGKG